MNRALSPVKIPLMEERNLRIRYTGAEEVRERAALREGGLVLRCSVMREFRLEVLCDQGFCYWVAL